MVHAPVNMPTADEVLAQLRAGNDRFISGVVQHPNQNEVRRQEVSHGQHPTVAMLSCADSRVPVELIFDQGIGDIFVVRVAGNILDYVVLGSLEYAALHVHVPLIVVLGHSKCGAVAATASGAKLEGHLPHIGVAIQPAVDAAKQMPGDLVDNAIRENAKSVAKQLATVPMLDPLVKTGKLRVVAAYYDLATGRYDLLPA